MLVITKEYLYLHITNSQTQKINAMEKQIKVGKITLNVTLKDCKVVRFWKQDAHNVKLESHNLDELKSLFTALKEESRTNLYARQSMTFCANHFNTRRIISGLIDVMENGKQTQEIVIR